MSSVVKAPVSGFSPYYGCVIMAAAALIFGGIVTWSAYTLLRQNADLDKITVDQPATFEPVRLSESEEQALAVKWQSLRKAIEAGEPGQLELSLAELNAAVVKAPDLGNGTYADIVRFTGTNAEKNQLLADISLPLNALPLSGKPIRYLVGRATFLVEVGGNGPDVRIVHLEAPGRDIPEGFVDSQSFWTWVAPYHKDETLSTVLKALRSARVTANGVILSTSAE